MKHTEEMIDRVRQLAASALTAREIADRAGLCSKDAVIGICYRYGIQLLVPKSEGWRYHKYKSWMRLTQKRIKAPGHARRRLAEG